MKSLQEFASEATIGLNRFEIAKILSIELEGNIVNPTKKQLSDAAKSLGITVREAELSLALYHGDDEISSSVIVQVYKSKVKR